MDSLSNSDFYASVAQVIPVLFVLLGIEYGLLVGSDQPEPGPWGLIKLAVIVGLVTTVGIGEYAALSTLFEEGATGSRDTAIVLTLVAQVALVVVIPFVPQLLAYANASTSKLKDRAEEMQAGQAEMRQIAEALDALGAEPWTEHERAQREQEVSDLERRFKALRTDRLYRRPLPAGPVFIALALLGFALTLLALYATPAYWLWVNLA